MKKEKAKRQKYNEGFMWTLYDKMHRRYGPALKSDRGVWWYFNNKLHRSNGPAIEFISGQKEWWRYGKRHREDGHAIEYTSGGGSWWLNHELFYDKHLYFKELEKLRGKEWADKIRLIYA